MSADQPNRETVATPAPLPRVAIVLRTKNRPLFLRRALDSVFAQTFSDFVVVVVNDEGEPTPVETVVKEFTDLSDGRIHIVHNAHSKGREAAMNTGVSASESIYLSIHDDDDTWAPTFLEQCVGHLENSADQAVAVRTEVVYEHVDGDEIIVDNREILARDQSQISLAEMIRRNYAPPISLLYRREVHEAVGLYDETLPVLADWDFNLRLLSRFTVGFIDGLPLAFWHQRPASVGDDANSVVTAQQDHARYEIEIRDRYLRGDLERNGHLGSLLYLTSMLSRGNTQLGDAAAHLETVIRTTDTERSNQVSGAVAHFEKLLRTAEASRIAPELADLNRNLINQNNRMIAQFEALAGRVNHLEELIVSQSLRARVRACQRGARRQLGRLADRTRRRS